MRVFCVKSDRHLYRHLYRHLSRQIGRSPLGLVAYASLFCLVGTQTQTSSERFGTMGLKPPQSHCSVSNCPVSK
ncbi:MAG: hypothetical protein SNJ57_01805 [Cyanobacteriota bacterium]